MKKANGILVVGKDANDYAYIGTFIGFLERIINIIINLFNIISKKDDAAEEAAATPTDGD